MKLRDLVLLVIALCLLSALVGVAVLVYLYVWRVPPATNAPSPGVLPTLTTPMAIQTVDPATPTPLPDLIVPTNGDAVSDPSPYSHTDTDSDAIAYAYSCRTPSQCTSRQAQWRLSPGAH